jgi:hypothetical protein
VSQALAAVARAELALAGQEEHILAQAQRLYQMGEMAAAVSPSQMAAVEERIRCADNHSRAVAAVTEFITGQIEKLRAREQRENRRVSWLRRPGTGAEADSLGEELLLWLREERYLTGKVPEGLDRLAALRRFWSRLHGLFRYEVETGAAMALAAGNPH